MTEQPVVAILGSRIRARTAAEIGYGRRELAAYAVGCAEAAFDAGMVPFGMASLAQMDERQCGDLVDGLILCPSGRCGNDDDEGDGGGAGDRFAPALVREALRRHLPVLAICQGVELLRRALASPAEDDVVMPDDAERRFTASRHEVMVDDPGLRDLLGAALTTSMPHHGPRLPPMPGFRVAATGPAGSIDALVGVDRPVLAVRWHPESLPPGDPAREVPFRWLRQQVGRA